MSNPSKAKGTRAETKIVRYLEYCGWRAKRKALTGSNDEGDIECLPPNGRKWLTLEVKAGKQTAIPNRTQLNEWLRQADIEAKNAGCDKSYLVVVRYRRQLIDADVYLQYEDKRGRLIRRHMYLDEFAQNC